MAVLGSKNRLDIVVKHPEGQGSIGLEVKCLGESGHCGKFTQGLKWAHLDVAGIAVGDLGVRLPGGGLEVVEILVSRGFDETAVDEIADLKKLGRHEIIGHRLTRMKHG